MSLKLLPRAGVVLKLAGGAGTVLVKGETAGHQGHGSNGSDDVDRGPLPVKVVAVRRCCRVFALIGCMESTGRGVLEVEVG